MSSEERETFNPVDPDQYYPGQQLPPDLQYQGGNTGAGGVPSPMAASQMGNPGGINDRNNPQYFRALRRQGFFITEPFQATSIVKTLRPLESRTYLFIQNIDTVGDIYIGFGNHPTVSNNLTLTPGSAYEPFTVPVNDIYILSSTGEISGFLIYSREPD